MAGPAKRKAVEKHSESSSNEGSDSESYHGQEEINADFEGRNPEEQDFHGIKQLLHQLFLKAHINIAELSDLLIAQTGVGSVLKQSLNEEDDDDDDEDDTLTNPLDVFGITSVINLSKHKQTGCVQQFCELLKTLAQKHATLETHTAICNTLNSNQKLGLLINERFVNIPAKISDPLLTSLLGELERIKQKDTTYDFDQFVMICKLHKQKGKEEEHNVDDVLYANAEEQLFAAEAKLQFEFSVKAESDSTLAGKWTEDDVELIPFRQVLVFKAKQLPSIVEKIKAFVN